MASTLRATLVSTLLLGIFSAVFLLVQYKFPVSLTYSHRWGHPRPLVPDSVAQELIRQLIEQADSGGLPRGGAEATGMEPVQLDFHISRVLLEHWPISTFLKMKDAEVRYRYGQESVSAMRQFYAEKMLSAADTAFMQQQLLHSTGFRLEAQYLPGCTIISVDTLTRLARVAEYGVSGAVKHLRRQYRTEAVSYLSAPLFSLHQRYALIRVTLDLGACGTGNTAGVLLEQRKGQWRPRRVLWQ